MLALPLELVDGIVDFVDDRPDILSLALTCRFLTDRLIPSVLDYREIATSIQPKALWTQLAENPSLAQNIRVLRIKELVGGALKIPRVFRLPPDERFVPDTTVLPLLIGIGNVKFTLSLVIIQSWRCCTKGVSDCVTSHSMTSI
ncbi:hypothetical protein JAAARDRAFT_429263 [Jaapia argillacea MUCL 33604]|uniref:F-box domain-containing protein n=1 Tax=Jaapia argillacea MUCL 33604 TaxID=933084 RepID=A0A067PFM9_9AGAM|nr:hypothetical protein JAAARDRAFT_429263 [Jaapia argillacea MUCL 33604]